MNIPLRSEVKSTDCWDLSSLYSSDDAWENDFVKFKGLLNSITKWKGTLNQGPASVEACLEGLNQFRLLSERLGFYAYLRLCEDLGDSIRQDRNVRFSQEATEIEAAASYIRPELLSLDQTIIDQYLNAPELSEFQIRLEKILRYKPHSLSASEERLLTLQEETNQTVEKTFKALTDVDIDFGTIDTLEGSVPLTQTTFDNLQLHSNRVIRENSWHQFYNSFDCHKHTIASLYIGSVKQDSYKAKILSFSNSLEASLFPDKVVPKVYHNLITTIRTGLPILHRHYSLRAKKLGLKHLSFWDTKVSLIPEISVRHTWKQAVELVLDSVKPLGNEYRQILADGIRDGWVDPFENKGKRSGAFSFGCYVGWPYILMNFKETDFMGVFTLAHESGHSMHSWYSVRHNPFQHYRYSAFEAEVASTFNEQLLFHYLKNQTDDRATRAYLINKEIDNIIKTVFRQTMFAEFELFTHRQYEEGSGLSLDSMRSYYRDLLTDYFGTAINIDPIADLEFLRIPHFYLNFYVYKYAAGLAASQALSEAVLTKKSGALEQYLNFLKSGGSSYPIENLAKAGVDLSTPQPIEYTLKHFESLLNEFEAIVS